MFYPRPSVIRGVPARKPAPRRQAKAVRAEFATRNCECARIILQDLERFGGPGSLMGQWAHAVVNGSEVSERQWRLVA